MKRNTLSFLIGFIFVCSCSLSGKNTPILATSIAPFSAYLQKIVGAHFQVINIAGDVTTAEEVDLSLYRAQQIKEAKLYFSFFLPFEQVLEEKQLILPNQFIRLDKAVQTISFSSTEQHHHHDESEGHHHSDNDIDPHIWTSPKQMLLILQYSLEKIKELDPEHAMTYENNFLSLKTELQDLDKQLYTVVHTIPNKEFLVFHPAYGYIAKDYGLKQIAIEKEGKETSLKDMEDVMKIITQKNIRVLLLQQLFPDSVIKNLEEITHIHIVRVNPLDPDYKQQVEILINALKKI